MGVSQSTVHFDDLNGVIDNHSGYQVRYKVLKPQPNSNQTNQDNQFEQFKSHQLDYKPIYVYAGIVMPYSTKYFDFKNIQNQYRFSVSLIKTNLHGQQQLISLEKDLLIQNQQSICIRITHDLKLIHLNEQQIKQLQVRKNLQLKFTHKSSIVNNPQYSHRLVGFLQKINLPLKDVKLLYRASQNNFNMKAFYQKYQLVDSVLFVCKTNKNKVIGGYTRVPFAVPQDQLFDHLGWRNIHDQTNTSFLFSLTSNDMFPLKHGHNVLYYNKNQSQICFGNDQLRISNHSDKNVCLTLNINANFHHQNYTSDQESFQILTGNEGPQFTTKQWEVWKIDFEQEQYDQLVIAQAFNF